MNVEFSLPCVQPTGIFLSFGSQRLLKVMCLQRKKKGKSAVGYRGFSLFDSGAVRSLFYLSPNNAFCSATELNQNKTK